MKYLAIILTLLVSSVYASDKHEEAARKHVELTGKVTSIEDLAESIVNGLLMSKPQFRPFKDVFNKFFLEMLRSDEYKDGLAEIYKNNFSPEELVYANQVFSDPRLASYLRKSPAIVKESMLLGERLMGKQSGKLNSALEARVKEIEKLTNENSNK